MTGRSGPRYALATSCAVLSLLAAGALAVPADSPAAATLAGYALRLDAEHKILSWVEPQEAAYATVVRLAWERLLTGFPVEANGLPTWLS